MAMAKKHELKSRRRPTLRFEEQYHTPDVYKSQQEHRAQQQTPTAQHTPAQHQIPVQHKNPAGLPATVQSPDFKTVLEPVLKLIKSVQDAIPVPNAPVPNAPVSNAPVSNAPVSNAPVSNAPVSNAPVPNAPVPNAPVPNALALNAGKDVSATVGNSNEEDLYDYFRQELKVDGLNAVHKYLWIAGSEGNISPLHRQLIMSRTIMKNEEPELHLVWGTGRIYIKPLPPFLISVDFWNTCLTAITHPTFTLRKDIDWPNLIGMALGMLQSYSCLIAYRSDYKVAIDLDLLPNDFGFEIWFNFLRDHRIRDCKASLVNQRYERGELRLGRLNMIYRFTQFQYVYFEDATEYYQYFANYLSVLALIFAFFSIVLSALQVLLSTTEGGLHFDDHSYFFVLFTLALVVVLLGGCFILCVVMVLWNLCKALYRNFLSTTTKKDKARRKTEGPEV